jgi:hypothetical protein
MENVSDAQVIDAEPAGTWMVAVTLRERWTKLAWWMVPSYALALWLISLQFQPTPVPYMAWGFAIFALGTFFGVRAFGIRQRRVFDTTELRYTHAQRVKRAAKWFVPGVAMLAIIWGMQWSSDQFSTYWWYAWPVLLPVVVGVGLYMLRSERVLSAAGQYARAQLDAAQAQVTAPRKARFEAVAGSGLVRYIGAAGCLYVAYWLTTDSTGKSTGWASLIWAVFALILARELGMWLLGIGLVIGAGWALFAGIAALPVSVAVVVGALIIASAVNKK